MFFFVEELYMFFFWKEELYMLYTHNYLVRFSNNLYQVTIVYQL